MKERIKVTVNGGWGRHCLVGAILGDTPKGFFFPRIRKSEENRAKLNSFRLNLLSSYPGNTIHYNRQTPWQKRMQF